MNLFPNNLQLEGYSLIKILVVLAVITGIINLRSETPEDVIRLQSEEIIRRVDFPVKPFWGHSPLLLFLNIYFQVHHP